MRGGDRGKNVIVLRRRLAASGDLTGSRQGGSEVFDSTLMNAVRRFQKRHGLETTGIVDSVTIVALNVPAEIRQEQIRANLERWRWLPHELHRKYIRVNVTDFKVTVVEGERDILSMKVVVGNPDWQTPVFSADMTQLLFNDYWMAPRHIVATELINYLKADSNYLPRNKMVLLRPLADSTVEIDARTINFATLDPKDIDFRLRQDPGPDNIMGQVKFLMPNKYDVFLHETPYREDFAKSVRMFSHGCIRLEKPYDLAEYILKDYSGWTKDTIHAVVQRIERRLVNLKDPIPVYVLYCTAWKEKDGTIQFREDHYGKDKRLSDALVEGSPAANETLAGEAKVEKR
jgi:murein L,D-transpeptidase YcbB/YkuD